MLEHKSAQWGGENAPADPSEQAQAVSSASGSSRRRALGLIGGAALGATGPARGASDPSLAALARRSGLVFGASIAEEALENPAYGDLYARETGLVVSDRALKFDFLRPDPGPPHFEPADALVDFAARRGLAFRGHTLVWNDLDVPWLKPLSARERTRVFDAHIDAVAGRYAGRFHSWDVVNEPFWPGHGAPGGYRRGPWYDALGPAYVERAFRRARAADGHARLVLNEAQTERSDAFGLGMRERLIGLVDRLLDAGVTLHAVGLQAHLQPQYPFDDQGFAAFLARLAERRVDLYITELDVDDLGLPDAPALRDEAVARRYAAFLGAVLTVPAVKLVVTWQLSDRYTWYRLPEVMRERRTTRDPRPLPFDADLAPKPARQALAAALGRRA